MQQVMTRVITVFILFNMMLSNLGMIGTKPVMAQTNNHGPLAKVEQQKTTPLPPVETPTEAAQISPTALPTLTPANTQATLQPDSTPTPILISTEPEVLIITTTPPVIDTPNSTETPTSLLAQTQTDTSTSQVTETPFTLTPSLSAISQSQNSSCTPESLKAVSIDSVNLQICLPFTPNYTSIAKKEDWVQVGSWAKTNPNQTLSIYSIPYGIKPADDILPLATPGISDVYKKDTLNLYRQNAASISEGPTVSIFGNSIRGDSYIFIENGSDQKMIIQWISEAGNRVWIVRDILYGNFGDVNFKNLTLSSLHTMSVNSQDLSNPSISVNLLKNQSIISSIPSPDDGISLVSFFNETLRDIQSQDLSNPDWWDGDCDTNNYLRQTGIRSYQLPGDSKIGPAIFRGVKACGSRLLNMGMGGVSTTFGGSKGLPQYEFQCAELPKRYLYQIYGILPKSADGIDIVNVYDNALPNLHKIANGTPNSGFAAGDILSYDGPSVTGHTAIVTSVTIDDNGNGNYSTIEQNSSPYGVRTNTITNWHIDSVSGISYFLHDEDNGNPTPTPSSTSAFTPPITPTSTPTSTPTNTPTFIPTNTPTPTPTIPAICASQSEIPQSECAALVALYNGTDGGNWIDHNDGLQTNILCSWFGVSCDTGHATNLSLNNNQLNSSIPTRLGNLVNLKYLELDDNQLSGSIRSELGSLIKLTLLSFWENQFSGNIPPQLANLTHLTILWLVVFVALTEVSKR